MPLDGNIGAVVFPFFIVPPFFFAMGNVTKRTACFVPLSPSSPFLLGDAAHAWTETSALSVFRLSFLATIICDVEREI